MPRQHELSDQNEKLISLAKETMGRSIKILRDKLKKAESDIAENGVPENPPSNAEVLAGAACVGKLIDAVALETRYSPATDDESLFDYGIISDDVKKMDVIITTYTEETRQIGEATVREIDDDRPPAVSNPPAAANKDDLRKLTDG